MISLNNFNINYRYDNNNKLELTHASVNIDGHEIYHDYDIQDVNKLDFSKDYVPKIGDIIYIGPGANIPRVKLKDLLLNNAAKTTKDFTKATCLFLDIKFNKFFRTSWEYKATVKALLQFIELIKEDHLEEDEYKYLINLLNKSKDDEMCVGYDISRFLQERPASLYKNNSTIYATRIRNNHIEHVKNEHIDLYNYILKNPDKIYDYKKLIVQLNSDDSITIDEKVFKQLGNMFQSTDEDNHIVAMEIMANSNYLESLMYLEMLFCDYGNAINNCPTKKHVNFKSLISFLNKHINYLYSTSPQTIIQSLMNKNVVTIDKLEYIFNKYKDTFVHNDDYFLVKSVTLNEELLKKLNTNYVKEVVPDYIPEILEKIEELEKEEESNEFSWIE